MEEAANAAIAPDLAALAAELASAPPQKKSRAKRARR
jgi:hypothetical protein